MPSPFPGMDPYLEGSFWTTVHFSFSAEIARQLAPKLRPRYLVLADERFVTAAETLEGVLVTRTDIYPDVGIVESGLSASESHEAAVAPAPMRLATVMPSRVPHVTIEIRDMANRELVTVIEVLSPTNKRGDGRKEYLAKRQHVLLSTAHLMEIDLLRSGQRVPMQQSLPPAPYFVFLSRAESRPLTEVWPIALNNPLPVVPIPLLSDDPDVPLDLQLAFTTIHDLFGYDLAVDYSRPPEVPLEGEAATWAEERIRTRPRADR